MCQRLIWPKSDKSLPVNVKNRSYAPLFSRNMSHFRSKLTGRRHADTPIRRYVSPQHPILPSNPTLDRSAKLLCQSADPAVPCGSV